MAVARGPLTGVQFSPAKCIAASLRILTNWVGMVTWDGHAGRLARSSGDRLMGTFTLYPAIDLD